MILAPFNCILGERLKSADDSPKPSAQNAGLEYSIVIPARNEASRIEPLLRSLNNLAPAPKQIIVVDDLSDDQTGEIARRFEGVDVIIGAGQGKAKALQAGIARASSDHCLLLDADVRILSPVSINLMLDRGDFVSVFPGDTSRGFWAGLSGASMLSLLAGIYPKFIEHKNLPGVVAANGQWILARRSLLSALLEDESVQGSLVEDMAMAKLAKQKGVQPVMIYGGDVVVSEMYLSLSAGVMAFARNGFCGPSHQAIVGLIFFYLLVTYGLTASFWGYLAGIVLTAVAAMTTGFSVLYALCWPLLNLYSVMVLMIHWAFKWGFFRVTWKGRVYRKVP